MFTRAGSNPSQFSTSLLSEKDKMRGQNRGVPPALTLLLVLCISAGAFVLGLHLNKKTPVLNVPATGQGRVGYVWVLIPPRFLLLYLP